jgi:hypothetical protein
VTGSCGRAKKASASFFKKQTKNFCSMGVGAMVLPTPPVIEVFLLLFIHEKTCLLSRIL